MQSTTRRPPPPGPARPLYDSPAAPVQDTRQQTTATHAARPSSDESPFVEPGQPVHDHARRDEKAASIWDTGMGIVGSAPRDVAYVMLVRPRKSSLRLLQLIALSLDPLHARLVPQASTPPADVADERGRWCSPSRLIPQRPLQRRPNVSTQTLSPQPGQVFKLLGGSSVRLLCLALLLRAFRCQSRCHGMLVHAVSGVAAPGLRQTRSTRRSEAWMVLLPRPRPPSTAAGVEDNVRRHAQRTSRSVAGVSRADAYENVPSLRRVMGRQRTPSRALELRHTVARTGAAAHRHLGSTGEAHRVGGRPLRLLERSTAARAQNEPDGRSHRQT
ncbi:hypothetical protein POSPLADRAFT_1063732 [Postia placenta MAD-698-R-SB12]|uniref:Uncharacterized protein n=1 Tax=Postia placenta MAD-698-R-SB12 TaxID=670580 RepID=A0A1X6MH76_9APHY|nr:hypothetical protein POSPLADRAFT_1063732 [Postia placenta MAD-698-R-SB12]OSX55700.1 hypothetical protein POSPLADRAFT_1063732 [Postia placenta MAD-698-R-SB12]